MFGGDEQEAVAAVQGMGSGLHQTHLHVPPTCRPHPDRPPLETRQSLTPTSHSYAYGSLVKEQSGKNFQKIYATVHSLEMKWMGEAKFEICATVVLFKSTGNEQKNVPNVFTMKNHCK